MRILLNEMAEHYNPNMRRRRTALKSLKRKDTVGIILLGDEKVGKSSVIKRWVRDQFTDNYEATVEDFFMKTVISLNQRVNVTIVDIAGSRQFPTMDDLYIAKSDAVLLVYEIGNEKSIQALQRYFQSARTILKEKKITYVVVGTKHDEHDSDTLLPDEVGHEYFTELAEQPHQFVTSASVGRNVDELFEHTIREVVKRSQPNASDKRARFQKQITLEAAEEDEEKKKCCAIL